MTYSVSYDLLWLAHVTLIGGDTQNKILPIVVVVVVASCPQHALVSHTNEQQCILYLLLLSFLHG